MSMQSTAVAGENEPTLAGATRSGVGRNAVRATPGMYRRAWQRLRRDHMAMAALIVVIAIVIFALAAPLVSKLTGFTFQENHLGDKLSKPGENGYILGSDGNGRDILTRLAYGGRVSL